MRTKVFYFSGTGNTLSLAGEISQMIKADLVSISNCVKMGNAHIYAEKAVIVFPSYLAPLSGLPLVVEKFIKSIHHWSRAPGIKYHHPEINLTDMITE